MNIVVNSQHGMQNVDKHEIWTCRVILHNTPRVVCAWTNGEWPNIMVTTHNVMQQYSMLLCACMFVYCS